MASDNVNYDDMFINEWLDELFGDKNVKRNPEHIPLDAVYNVPYLTIPGYTEKECDTFHKIAQMLLRTSRAHNSEKEVSITYDVAVDENPLEKDDWDGISIVEPEYTPQNDILH